MKFIWKVALQDSSVSLDDELGCPGSPRESSLIAFLSITFFVVVVRETDYNM